MKELPTPEMIAKLPKWAQAHITDLDRRAVVAERTLREFYDNSTPSEMYTSEWDSDRSKLVKRFIQSNKLEIERDGLKLDILIRQDDPGIDITWSDETRMCCHIPCVPMGLNHIRVMLKKDLR